MPFPEIPRILDVSQILGAGDSSGVYLALCCLIKVCTRQGSGNTIFNQWAWGLPPRLRLPLAIFLSYLPNLKGLQVKTTWNWRFLYHFDQILFLNWPVGIIFWKFSRLPLKPWRLPPRFPRPWYQRCPSPRPMLGKLVGFATKSVVWDMSTPGL